MLAGATGRRSWKCEREAACPTVLSTPDSSRLHRRRFRFKLWMCFSPSWQRGMCRELRLQAATTATARRQQQRQQPAPGSHKGLRRGVVEQSCAFSALFCIQLRLLASGSWAKPRADCAVGALCKGNLGGLQVLLPFKCPSCPSRQPLRRCCGWARMNSAKEAHRNSAGSLRLLAFRHMRHRLL